VRGEVVVQVLSDVPGRFDKGSRVVGVREGAPPVTLAVAASRPHKTGAVVRFEGFEDPDQADELRGLDLEVPRSEVPPAPPGTYYQYELLGCLCRHQGEEGEELLGRVVEVVEDGGGLMLIVAGEGRRVPVPFVQAFLREVDVESGRIDLSLPPGFLEACESRS
jgi:16S rRNA processing protein RimM